MRGETGNYCFRAAKADSVTKGRGEQYSVVWTPQVENEKCGEPGGGEVLRGEDCAGVTRGSFRNVGFLFRKGLRDGVPTMKDGVEDTVLTCTS